MSKDPFHYRASKVGLKLKALQQAMACGREPKTPRNIRRLAALTREWDRLRKA